MLRSSSYAALVMESQVFLGPMPINENKKSRLWIFTLATALLETGAGSGCSFGSAACSIEASRKT